jgi:hypothetical protein
VVTARPNRSPAAIHARAAEEANRAAPHLRSFFNVVLPLLPTYPLSSQNIRTLALQRWSVRLPLDDAITCPWIALNTNQRVNALCVDIDHPDGPDLVASLPVGCPKPTLVIDPWSGRSHAILPLAAPVLTGNAARPKPIALAKHARRLLAAAIRGTPLPFGNLVKSPAGLVRYLGGPRLFRGDRPATPLAWDAYVESGTKLMWLTQLGDGLGELRAVAAALADCDDAPRTTRRPDLIRNGTQDESSAVGRNCDLFYQLRTWCYREVERDPERILAEAARLNAMFSDPLPPVDVAATARSIAKFMQHKYAPRRDSCTRGRDRIINRGLDTKGRQGLAGKRSAEQRKAASIRKIEAAVAELRKAGDRIRQRQVAVLAKVSERTVRSMLPAILAK